MAVPTNKPPATPTPDEVAKAKAAADAEPTVQNEIELDEEFIHHGKIYGPGKLTVKDDGTFKAADIFRDLYESQERVRRTRPRGYALIRPNRAVTGIVNGTELDDHIANALSPDEVREQYEEQQRRIEEQVEDENDRTRNKARRTTPVPASPAAEGGK